MFETVCADGRRLDNGNKSGEDAVSGWTTHWAERYAYMFDMPYGNYSAVRNGNKPVSEDRTLNISHGPETVLLMARAMHTTASFWKTGTNIASTLWGLKPAGFRRQTVTELKRIFTAYTGFFGVLFQCIKSVLIVSYECLHRPRNKCSHLN